LCPLLRYYPRGLWGLEETGSLLFSTVFRLKLNISTVRVTRCYCADALSGKTYVGTRFRIIEGISIVEVKVISFYLEIRHRGVRFRPRLNGSRL
jgi:hypothetical protein